MGKKKRSHPGLEDILARPWCYYCERDFDDLKILISHQRAKHFKCERCHRRLNTAGGLSVHLSQVHKEQLSEVENAMPERAGLDVEIFGMEGIPEDVLQSHNQLVTSQYQQAEEERRAATGNPPPGTKTGVTKKPRLENPSELKQRLAEHRAKIAEQNAAKQASVSSGISAFPQGYSGQASTVESANSMRSPFASPVPTTPGFSLPVQAQSPVPKYPQVGASYQPHPTQTPPSIPVPGSSIVQPAAAGPYSNPPMLNTPAATVPVPAQPQGQPVPSPIPNSAITAPETATPTTAEEKATKKQKGKTTRLVYSETEISVEEKMASMPRYAFIPERDRLPSVGVTTIAV